jgi:hypothetical protein
MSEYKLNAEQRGRAAAMYRAHADGDGIEELVYQLIWLSDRVEELEADAARYRRIEDFIGQHGYELHRYTSGKTKRMWKFARPFDDECYLHPTLDAAVDEARSKP